MHEWQQDAMKQVMAKNPSIGGSFDKPGPEDGAGQKTMEQFEIWADFELTPGNSSIHDSFHPLFSRE